MRKRLALYGGPPVRERPFPVWPVYGSEEESALLEVLRSRKWGRIDGTRTADFERVFAEYQDCTYGVAVFNGTVALQLALLAAGIGEGDEVIVPPYTFLATATSVMLCNAVPIFVDIDPQTYCIDPEAIEPAITDRTKAIIPVHLGGQAADMDRILAISRAHGLMVIEDCAHAHGAEYKGRRVGSLGDLGCFSFQSSKNLTSGEGGIVVANDEELAGTCRSMHNCGRVPGGAWYDHRALSLNLRMTEFQAALLQCGMERLDAQIERREANGLYLNDALSEIPGIDPLPRGHGETRHGYHLYTYRYDEAAFGGVPRGLFVEALRAEGIPSVSGYDVPLYHQRIFVDRVFGPYTGYRTTRPEIEYADVTCPACEQACREGCWLTQSMLLGTREDMDDIVTGIRKVYEHREVLRLKVAR
jgi:dTDP-4-amino-4,6-dideoxygalactose transaminase